MTKVLRLCNGFLNQHQPGPVSLFCGPCSDRKNILRPSRPVLFPLPNATSLLRGERQWVVMLMY